MEKISGFESLESEFEHTCAITKGMDELVLAINESNELTPDAVYTDTVLKLNGIELVELSGTEGFLDGVKKGAMKVYEWVKQLVKTIRDWFAGSNKKEYDQAKKEITEDLVLVKRISELKERGIDAYLKHDPGEGVTTIVRRLPQGAKKEINAAIKTVEAVSVSTPEDISNAVIIPALSLIASRTVTAMKGIKLRIEEVKRIDPTGETLDALGLSLDSVIVDTASGSYFEKMDNKDFANDAKVLVKDSEAAQSELSKATTSLDRMNEAAKGHEGTERGSQLSRAVSIVKLLAEIAGIYRDVIISINSQLTQASKHAEHAVIKKAIQEALKNTDEATSKYLDAALAAL